MRIFTAILFILTFSEVTLAQQFTKAQFMQNPFPEKLTPQILQDRYWWRVNTSNKTVKNPHNNRRDTITTVSIGGSEIAFYVSPQKIFVLSGNIRNRRIPMRSGIKIWMSRKEFFSRFKDLAYDDSKKVVISDKHGFYRYTFLFFLNRLRKVQFKVYPD